MPIAEAPNGDDVAGIPSRFSQLTSQPAHLDLQDLVVIDPGRTPPTVSRWEWVRVSED